MRYLIITLCFNYNWSVLWCGLREMLTKLVWITSSVLCCHHWILKPRVFIIGQESVWLVLLKFNTAAQVVSEMCRHLVRVAVTIMGRLNCIL